jgi:hypothetical protein
MGKHKYLLIFTALFMVVFLSSCATTTSNSSSGFKPSDKLLEMELELSKIKEADEEASGLAQQLKEKGFPIAIYEHYPSKPNSADGVNVSIAWNNLSPKEIKYITFTVKPYNAVDDVVFCNVSGDASYSLKVTGPIKAWNMDDNEFHFWENVWYNNTIKRIEIEQIDIIYMDNSEVSITASEIKEMFIDRFALYREYGVSSIDYFF